MRSVEDREGYDGVWEGRGRSYEGTVELVENSIAFLRSCQFVEWGSIRGGSYKAHVSIWAVFCSYDVHLKFEKSAIRTNGCWRQKFALAFPSFILSCTIPV